MRRTLAIPIAIALAALACGGDDDASTPMEVVEAENEAAMDGDVEAVVGYWSEDGVVVFPDGTEIGILDTAPFPVNDHDGDGTGTMLDVFQTETVMNPALGVEVTLDCTETSDTEVECTETRTSDFETAHGIEGPGSVTRRSVADGLIVRLEIVGPPGDDWDAARAADEATAEAMAQYEQWVEDTHPEEYPQMFEHGQVIALAESATLHLELMPEYLESLEI